HLARWLLLAACFGLVGVTRGQPVDADALFVHRVLPTLKARCFACHGEDMDRVKSDFVLLSREEMLKGGERGVPSVVPGRPQESPLYLAVTRKHDRWEAMPPKESDRLSAEDVGTIELWIALGAPWPDDARQKELASQPSRWSAPGGVPVPTSGGL